MKTRSIIGLMCMFALGAMTVSCSDDDEPKWNDEGSHITLPDSRAFILNEGTKAQNNANIEFFSPAGTENDIIPNFYFKQNDAALGDIGQCMIKYNNNMYVSLYGSNYLAKLNTAGVEVARASFVADPELSAGIRFLAAKDGYIYASFYGGTVAKIDAATLEVRAKLKGLGANLEGVAIAGDNLYVANSYEVTKDPVTGKNKYNYYTEVPVVDLKTFTHGSTLSVTSNPNQLLEKNGKVFLISWDYSEPSYVLQLIDPAAGNRVSRIGYATNMAACGDILYLVDSRTDYSNYPVTVTVNTFSWYDINSGELHSESFLKNVPAELSSSSVYMMATDEYTGDIYIGVTHYADYNGDMYRFRKDGTYVGKFDCGGQNPRSMVFFN